MDALYVIGKQTQWNDHQELRLSLRSLVENYPTLGKVWIVGHKPDWVQNVNHIPMEDFHAKNIAGNIIEKILKTCRSAISNDFVLIMDDYFFLKPVSGEQLRTVRHHGSMRNFSKWEPNLFERTMLNTIKVLKSRGAAKILNCEAHCPVVINKGDYLEKMKLAPVSEFPAVLPRSFYFSLSADKHRFRDTAQVGYMRAAQTVEQLQNVVKDKLFSVIVDGQVSEAMKRFLEQRFPERSPFEKTTEIPMNFTLKNSLVRVGMASTPARQDTLELTLRSILPQCNKLVLYLNNYYSLPDYLKQPTAFLRKPDFDKIQVFRSQDFGDLGSLGKFFTDGTEFTGFKFTIDDDILFPPDYVQTLTSWLNKYDRKIAVGVHGGNLNLPVESYYKSLNNIFGRFENPLPEARFVHSLGTGTMAYHTDLMDITQEFFIGKNFDDPQVSSFLQKRKIPRLIVPRRYKWLVNIDRAYGQSIHNNRRTVDRLATQIVNEADWSELVTA